MNDQINKTKDQWIKEIEQLAKENNNIIFSAEGYCPAESEEEDLTGSGHYWTEWDELETEELIDKIKDEDYNIEKWSFNILEQNKESKKTIDIFSENRSENQVCHNCKNPNPFGDLLCDFCYKEIEKQHQRNYDAEYEQER